MGYATGVFFSTLQQKYIIFYTLHIIIFLKHTTRMSLEIWLNIQWPIPKDNVQDISKLYAFYNHCLAAMVLSEAPSICHILAFDFQPKLSSQIINVS